MLLDADDIRALLPHEPPMLFVDGVSALTPCQSAKGHHDVRADAMWAAGHFPGNPIMPGVLIAEALAQLAAIVFLADSSKKTAPQVLLVGLDKMRFRRPVRPGERVDMAVEALSNRHGLWTFQGEAIVEGQRVANGTFMAAINDGGSDE